VYTLPKKSTVYTKLIKKLRKLIFNYLNFRISRLSGTEDLIPSLL